MAFSRFRGGQMGGRDEDAAALMRVLDELCGVVGEFGLPCAAPLAPARGAGLLWLLKNGIAYLDASSTPAQPDPSSWDALADALAATARHEGGRPAVWAAVQRVLALSLAAMQPPIAHSYTTAFVTGGPAARPARRRRACGVNPTGSEIGVPSTHLNEAVQVRPRLCWRSRAWRAPLCGAAERATQSCCTSA